MAQSALSVTDLQLGSGADFQTGDSLNVNYILTIGGFEENGGRVIDATRTRGRPFS